MDLGAQGVAKFSNKNPIWPDMKAWLQAMDVLTNYMAPLSMHALTSKKMWQISDTLYLLSLSFKRKYRLFKMKYNSLYHHPIKTLFFLNIHFQ